MKVLEERVEGQVKHFFGHLCDRVEETGDYVVVRVYHKDLERFTKQY